MGGVLHVMLLGIDRIGTSATVAIWEKLRGGSRMSRRHCRSNPWTGVRREDIEFPWVAWGHHNPLA